MELLSRTFGDAFCSSEGGPGKNFVSWDILIRILTTCGIKFQK